MGRHLKPESDEDDSVVVEHSSVGLLLFGFAIAMALLVLVYILGARA